MTEQKNTTPNHRELPRGGEKLGIKPSETDRTVLVKILETGEIKPFLLASEDQRDQKGWRLTYNIELNAKGEPTIIEMLPVNEIAFSDEVQEFLAKQLAGSEELPDQLSGVVENAEVQTGPETLLEKAQADLGVEAVEAVPVKIGSELEANSESDTTEAETAEDGASGEQLKRQRLESLVEEFTRAERVAIGRIDELSSETLRLKLRLESGDYPVASIGTLLSNHTESIPSVIAMLHHVEEAGGQLEKNVTEGELIKDEESLQALKRAINERRSSIDGHTAELRRLYVEFETLSREVHHRRDIAADVQALYYRVDSLKESVANSSISRKISEAISR